MQTVKPDSYGAYLRSDLVPAQMTGARLMAPLRFPQAPPRDI